MSKPVSDSSPMKNSTPPAAQNRRVHPGKTGRCPTCARQSLVAIWLAVAVSSADADGLAVLKCRQIPDAAKRFECYEAIPVTPTTVQATTALPTGATSVEKFGIEQKATQVTLAFIESSIKGRFLGWEPNEQILLTNGQVWQVTDDSKGALVATDPKVLVRRGALGAFYLEIDGTNRTPRVRRVK
jgi:hypothetical protein